jgi:hypothetical protein
VTDEVIQGPFAVAEKPDGCSTCAFWFSPSQQNVGYSPSGREVGLCRRFPPATLVVGAQTAMNGTVNAITQAGFPPIDDTGWCGEHKKRPNS